MTVQFCMIEIETYCVTFPIDEFTVFINGLDGWLLNPDCYFIALVEDTKISLYTSHEPIRDPEQKLGMYFPKIQRMWCCSIPEVVGMLKYTHESLEAKRNNAILWRLTDNGIVGAEFNFPASEVMN